MPKISVADMPMERVLLALYDAAGGVQILNKAGFGSTMKGRLEEAKRYYDDIVHNENPYLSRFADYVDFGGGSKRLRVDFDSPEIDTTSFNMEHGPDAAENAINALRQQLNIERTQQMRNETTRPRTDDEPPPPEYSP